MKVLLLDSTAERSLLSNSFIIDEECYYESFNFTHDLIVV